jgi:hypothetical protein
MAEVLFVCRTAEVKTVLVALVPTAKKDFSNVAGLEQL